MVKFLALPWASLALRYTDLTHIAATRYVTP